MTPAHRPWERRGPSVRSHSSWSASTAAPSTRRRQARARCLKFSCPTCGIPTVSIVLETRQGRRRRECVECGNRFATIELVLPRGVRRWRGQQWTVTVARVLACRSVQTGRKV